MAEQSQTIFAIASGQMRAGVSVLRVSGPGAFASARRLTGDLPALRRAALRTIRDPENHEIVDIGLILCFPADGSFTGEKTVEYQIHGSPAVQAALLRCLAREKDHRPAQPGEFTRRALENDRMDLSQVDGLADLIDAETEAQRHQALRVMRGDLGQRVEGWRKNLVRVAALFNATIDFADEDLPEHLEEEAASRIRSVLSDLRDQLAGAQAAERIRDGFEVAIIGSPNAGKSTLLNACARREAALTSEIAGTTRDVIEVRMDIGGVPVTLLDTAGLRATTDPLEKAGIARARARADQADLRIFLLCAGEDPASLEMSPREKDIVVQGKADLQPSDGFAVSGKTGYGIDALLERIGAVLSARVSTASSVIRERYRLAMLDAVSSLESALDHVSDDADQVDLASEEIRSALRHLDVMIGRVDVEDLLDEIFSSFCLGK